MTLSKLQLYAQLIRFDRPIGSLLLLWPTLWGLWGAARGAPDHTVFLVFVAGTFLMRSAGCAINDYADRDFDGHVARTAMRPVAAGLIAPREALWVAGTLALIAFLLAVVFLNALTVQLSFIAAFLAASYPFTKRFLVMPQAYLGVAFGFGIPMAFTALTGAVPEFAWWLFAANIFYTISYDTLYAMVDREDDLKLGVKTSAIFFGRFDLAAVSACYVAMTAILLVAADRFGLSPSFVASVLLALVIAGWQVWAARGRQREACFRAFLQSHWLGAVIFLGLVASFWN